VATLKASTAIIESAHRCHFVRAEEDVGALRRAVVELASRCLGLRAADAALVATELGTNLVRHATPGGYVLYRADREGIELLAVDRGPGLAHQGQLALRGAAHASPDPPARRRGLGIGLGVVARTATEFDLYSSRPGGTVVLARLLSHPRQRTWCRWGAVNVPRDHVGDSGDGWMVSVNGTLTALVVDGLGHGEAAARAARAAISVFAAQPGAELADLMDRADQAMRSTRGGALGACSIDPGSPGASFGAGLRYVGVGNVVGRLFSQGKSQGLVGREGTLGTPLGVRRAPVATYQWPPGATVILASDGLRTRWDPLAYPGLLGRDPSVVAAVLHRDFGRTSDDATVLVIEDLRSGSSGAEEGRLASPRR